MSRLFLPVDENPRTIHITGEKAHYLSSVLRCGKGEELEVLDGKGNSYRARITTITRKEIVAEVIGVTSRDTESPLTLVLVQGLLKGEKMELVIQKATELGVSEVIPVVTERSQVRTTGKVTRWRRIAEDASRQSGRTSVPMIPEVLPFSTFLLQGFSPPSSHAHSGGLLFSEKGGMNLHDAAKDMKGCRVLTVAVGPEGGFTDTEVRAAAEKGFVIATLGSRILRAETAAITAAVLSQFLFGDIASGTSSGV